MQIAEDGRENHIFMQDKLKYEGITFEVSVVTPEKAQEVLNKHNGINRRINDAHVKALARNMARNTWLFNGDTIRFDVDGNLIDGQHRLSALVMFGKPLPMLIARGFKRNVINTIDQEVKPRNLCDLFTMEGVKDARNVASIVQRYFVILSGSRMIVSSPRKRGSAGYNGENLKRRYTIEERHDEYWNHSLFYDNVTVYARRLYKKMCILKASEIGSVYAYLYFQRHRSDDEIQGFFNRLCLGESDINVINLLRELYIRDGRSKTPMMSSTKTAYLAKTWNYYISGKDVKVLSYNKNTEGQIDFI